MQLASRVLCLYSLRPIIFLFSTNVNFFLHGNLFYLIGYARVENITVHVRNTLHLFLSLVPEIVPSDVSRYARGLILRFAFFLVLLIIFAFVKHNIDLATACVACLARSVMSDDDDYDYDDHVGKCYACMSVLK